MEKKTYQAPKIQIYLFGAPAVVQMAPVENDPSVNRSWMENPDEDEAIVTNPYEGYPW